MNALSLVLYFAVSAVAAVVIARFTAPRRGAALAAVWAVVVLLVSGLGIAAWAIWFGFTNPTPGRS